MGESKGKSQVRIQLHVHGPKEVEAGKDRLYAA